MKHFLYLIIVFFTYNSYCQVNSACSEKKALNFVLINIDSIPIYNLQKYIKTKRGQVYYHFYNDTLSVSKLTGNSSWKKDNLFEEDSTYIGKRNYHFNDSISWKVKAKNTDLSINEFEKTQRKNDVFIGIYPKWFYKNNYYVLFSFYTNGDLMNCTMVIKFDGIWNFQKFVYQCGVE